MRNSGQALLLVLLTMGVVLVVSLSTVTRSVSDISITTQEEESLRAFSAAEAGVEDALIEGLGPADPDLNQVVSNAGEPGETTYNVTADSFPVNSVVYNYPQDLSSGDTGTIWLMSHDSNGDLVCGSETCYIESQISVCWGEAGTGTGDATTPAIEVSVVYNEAGTAKVARTAIDPNSGRRGSNSFVAPNILFGQSGCAIDTAQYMARADIDFETDLGIPDSVSSIPGNLRLMVIRMLYNTNQSQPLGVIGRSILPSQGTVVDSTGAAGESFRKVRVFTLYPDLPHIFDTVLYSPSGIIHE